MPFYRKKPVVIEAIQWDGSIIETGSKGSADFIEKWSEGATHCRLTSQMDAAIFIPTLEGEMRADVGDYIIRGVQGEYYPCKADIFAATYEPVENNIIPFKK